MVTKFVVFDILKEGPQKVLASYCRQNIWWISKLLLGISTLGIISIDQQSL